MADWGLLSKQDEGKIERCRQAHLESDKGEAVVELVQLCIHSRLSVLRELVNSEIGSVDKDGSKLDERIYDMLGYPGLHVVCKASSMFVLYVLFDVARIQTRKCSSE